MGGMMSQPDPNRIDIDLQGCSGNAGWLFGGRFDGNPMDPRLLYYMTAEEYQGTLEKLNGELGKQQKSTGTICVVLLVLCGISAILYGIFSSLHSPELTECAAAKGFCPANEFNPSAAQCCLVYCCPGLGNRPGPGQYSTSCSRLDKEWGTKEECNCKKNAKGATVCEDEVKLEGELRVTPEENEWAGTISVFIIFVAVGFGICNLVNCVVQSCSLRSKLALHWGIWQSKGINVSYFAGSKHSRARLMLAMPAGGPHMQGGGMGAMPPPVYGGGAAVQPVLQTTVVQPQPVGQNWPARSAESDNPAPLQATIVSAPVAAPQTMQVQCPQGVGPGGTIQLNTPAGQAIQVQVPAGVQPGAIFTIQY